MMGTDVTLWPPASGETSCCIACGKVMPRDHRAGKNFRALPRGWLAAIGTQDDSGDPLIIIACSKACAESWERTEVQPGDPEDSVSSLGELVRCAPEGSLQ